MKDGHKKCEFIHQEEQMISETAYDMPTYRMTSYKKEYRTVEQRRMVTDRVYPAAFPASTAPTTRNGQYIALDT